MSPDSTPRADVVIVGAGIVGLAHALAAVERGLSVTILDRDDRAVGASIRNFGHGCFTAQTDLAYEYGQYARALWLRMARGAGFDAHESGTVMVARSTEELAALEELAVDRGPEEVLLLDPAQVRERAPIRGDGVLGGAFFPRDIRIDQRGASAAIADWLMQQPGVEIRWATPVLSVEPGVVHTAAGDVLGAKVVVCVGHDVDRLAPAAAAVAQVTRCELQMMQVRAPGLVLDPAVLTGSSMLRYPALAQTAGAQALRTRWEHDRPDLLDAVVNHMLTQRPDGDLIVGDTHRYGRTLDPFEHLDSEVLDELLLTETRRLLGRDDLQVIHRWRGIYASAPEPFLRARLGDATFAVSVTSGIGMTTAFGLAHAVFEHDLNEGTHR